MRFVAVVEPRTAPAAVAWAPVTDGAYDMLTVVGQAVALRFEKTVADFEGLFVTALGV